MRTFKSSVMQKIKGSGMISAKDKLRKISDGIFQEAEPPKDRKRPLEWRRSFNLINLPLKSVKIISSCTVHDTAFSMDEEKITNPLMLLKPNVSYGVAITGMLDEDQAQDSIYFAVENKKEEGIYSIERARGETKVTIKSGEPTESTENTPAGLYRGNAFRLNFDPGKDDLCFELRIPEKQINSLIESLREDENGSVEIGVYLLSFTFEVDDFLREHYHHRDIVINEVTHCFVYRAGISSKIGQHDKSGDAEHEEEAGAQYKEEQTPELPSNQELIQVLLSYSKPIYSLVIAVWVLIFVIVIVNIP
jgi:hypothetical protein